MPLESLFFVFNSILILSFQVPFSLFYVFPPDFELNMYVLKI